MKSLLAAAASALVLASASPTHAQSFNCRYAKLPAEVAICQHPDLRALDSKEARLHSEWLNVVVTGRAGVIRLQRTWIQRRNRCGYDPACLRAAYKAKIDELENGTDDH